MGSQRVGAGSREFAGFEEYFPHYVSQHSRPATRWLHFAGTHLGPAARARSCWTGASAAPTDGARGRPAPPPPPTLRPDQRDVAGWSSPSRRPVTAEISATVRSNASRLRWAGWR